MRSSWKRLAVDEHVRGSKVNDVPSVGDTPHAADYVGSADLVIAVPEARSVELK